MKITSPLTLAALAAIAYLPLAGLAQTPTPAPAPAPAQPSTEINPFSRQFVTPEQMAPSIPAPPSVNPAAPVAVAPPGAPSGPSAPPAPRLPAPPPPSAAPPARVQEPAPSRFIPDGPRNTGSLTYFEGRGEAQSAHYGNAYGQSPPRPNAAGALPSQVEMLGPLVWQLRAQGVDEGKISIELNRLTPAQFAHWAQQSLR